MSAAAAPAPSPAEAEGFAKVVARLEAVLPQLENRFGPAGAAALVAAAAAEVAGGAEDKSGEHPSAAQYEQIISGPVATVVALSQKIGGDVAVAGALLQAAFVAQQRLVSIVPLTQKPGDKILNELLEANVQGVAAVQKFKETHAKTAFPNHLSALAEAVNALSWITVVPTPAPFVKDMWDCAAFYSNRVLKDFKESDPTHVEWARALAAAFDALGQFVKQHHTTGLAWGQKIRGAAWWANTLSATAPGDTPPDQYKFSTSLGQPVLAHPGVGELPEPEPLKPQRPLNPIAKAALLGRDDMPKDSLLGALNVGEGITSGLRKVDNSEKTHKNPELRASSVVPASASAGAAAAAVPSAPAKAAVAKEPVFQLVGKKWTVEHQRNNNELVVNGDPKHSVYIYNCSNSTVQVKGKVNSIVCDTCTKTAVVCENVIASFEFVNCKSMQLQVLGYLPTISIEKTDGCQVYLSAESLACDIVTAKSSEMNVLVPGGEDGDFTEMPVPEQFKTVWQNGKLVTTINELNL